MKDLVRSNIRSMKPYCPPIEGRRSYVGHLLDFNERTEPYGEIGKKILSELSMENRFQCYPEYGDINKSVADYTGVGADSILLTNGSDQGIDLVFRTFTNSGDEVIIPSPSFAMFYQCAELCDNTVVFPTYDNRDGSFPIKEVLDAINSRTKLIIVCNPNNPTGSLVPLSDIEKILKRAKQGVVLVDEAYFEYSGVSAVQLMKKYSNLVIIRTFSKAFGLAALRVGYILASPLLIKELNKVRGPYDVNMAGVVVAQGVLEDIEPLKSYVREVMEVSKPLAEQFFNEYKIFFYPSKANFILFKPKNVGTIFKLLRQNGFLLRPRKGFGFDNTLRFNLGNREQTKEFIEMYKRICLKN